ncbi:Hypothetical protein HDN1F_15970 [gamma proteobacterium HdN1]|nr:Hypothetical protein HDN1F_15970 [gamma proteobacterium HdN1]
MHPTEFVVSLRIKHPTHTHHSIIKSIGMVPKFSYSVGSPRATPKGRPLEGVYKHSYCSFTLLEKQEGYFVDGIKKMFVFLEPHKEYFRLLTCEGGKAELFVGIFADGTVGFGLGVEEMRVLSGLSLELSVEVYNEDSACSPMAG